MANNSRNPTKSVMMNELIKRVKKDDVRKLGKPSRAICSLEMSEFAELIEKYRSKPSGDIGHRIGIAYFIIQFHMIARFDDVMNFKLEDLIANIEHSYTIKSKMQWSKNVLQGREKILIRSFL